MNIALNTSSIKEPLTGLGRYSLNLAEALQQLQTGHLEFFDGISWSSEILVRPAPKGGKYREFIRDYFPFAYPIKFAFSQFRFSKGLSKKIDLYHEPNYLAFKSTIPTVITVHDLSWISFPEVHPSSRVREMNRFFERSLAQAHHIITDSEFIKRQFIDYFNYPADQVTAIPLGVSASFRPYLMSEIQACIHKYSLVYSNYFLLLGTLEPRKNLVGAINSFRMLPKSLRQSNPLVIAGAKGWLDSDIRKSISSLLQTGEVRVLGYLPQIDLPYILGGARALLFPSIYEGFGLPPLEAMACGTPVIASNRSSIPEVVRGGGTLLDPNDYDGFAKAMKKFIDDPKLRDFYARNALEQSKQFTWERCALKTFNVYKHVLSSKNTSLEY